ncbi:hypothetical protein GCM10017600_40100 [Streptosporangium carneum]|uniref:Uncharacterized protein n=1 Tax=Streptosporangium carneum TaxID=47481 RepID=A0A9W6I3K0_9ACTN|nr:hypothetical protein GCM10017600_40100 [Streptosporangium carneum]
MSTRAHTADKKHASTDLDRLPVECGRGHPRMWDGWPVFGAVPQAHEESSRPRTSAPLTGGVPVEPDLGGRGIAVPVRGIADSSPVVRDEGKD